MEKVINEADKKIILSENPIIKKLIKINSSMTICDKLLEGEENDNERLAILEHYHELNKDYINALAEHIIDYNKKIDDIDKRYENIISTLNSRQKELLEDSEKLRERIKTNDLEYNEFLEQLAYCATTNPEIVISSLIEYAVKITEAKSPKLKVIKGKLN